MHKYKIFDICKYDKIFRYYCIRCTWFSSIWKNHTPNSNILTAGLETTVKSYMYIYTISSSYINKEYSADREIFSRYVFRRPEIRVFFDETLVARVLLLSPGPRKKTAQDIHPFALLTRPSSFLSLDRRWWHRCICMCVYVCVSSVFIPLPQQQSAILLTTYLTHDLRSCLPRVRAWWPSKTQILSVVRSCPRWEQGRPRGHKISRILAIPLLSEGGVFLPGSVLNLILVGSDSVNNVSIGHRDSHSITCRECRYTVLITRHSVNSCQSFFKAAVFAIARRLKRLRQQGHDWKNWLKESFIV